VTIVCSEMFYCTNLDAGGEGGGHLVPVGQKVRNVWERVLSKVVIF
jgi:hypothetical protein